ncbi:hypothetical protein PCASD_16316 [Puccinia coronata f. sp. avenae]|uniref:Uncharacterized protein n=1 Tax=Puccinia coronata f. sp. avenae TaxID=200324 RepID=A0A2N5SYZ6_9BASI|nr:hypothetical protein PCASD_19533 [Puccinia coronata f. sp. avenae]PLW36052.1 hypothetical protein PCASD_16316 [Puccinia coronata f. sp. avenae]
MSSQPSSARPALMVLWSQTKDTGTIILGLKHMNQGPWWGKWAWPWCESIVGCGEVLAQKAGKIDRRAPRLSHNPNLVLLLVTSASAAANSTINQINPCLGLLLETALF